MDAVQSREASTDGYESTVHEDLPDEASHQEAWRGAGQDPKRNTVTDSGGSDADRVLRKPIDAPTLFHLLAELAESLIEAAPES